MTTRALLLRAVLATAALTVGAACSDNKDDDTAAAATTSTTAAKAGGAGPTTTITSPPAVQPGPPAAATDAATTVTVTTSPATTATNTGGGTPVALTANLTGDAEVPDPGIPGGTGVATLRITGMEMCYTLNASITEQPLVAHIHKGAAGEAGDIVINFEVVFQKVGSAFIAEKCLNKDPGLLAGIIAKPATFYVNIHTGEHPKGALRGQLTPS